MPDTNSNNPGNTPNKSGLDNNVNMDYELITAYIDNEITDPKEKDRIQNLIASDSNYYNRYIFEKLTKENLKKKSKRIDTQAYVYKNIGNEIDNYIKKTGTSKNIVSDVTPNVYAQQLSTQKSNLKRYLLYGSYAVIALVAFAFILNYFLKRNPDLKEHDLVSVSRVFFDRVKNNDVKVEHKTSSAKELEEFMNQHLNFKVYVPDVKDAVLVGGVCNEIDGEMLAHFIYKKGNVIIYTLEANMSEVMNNDEDEINLVDQQKQNIKEGKNYSVCLKDKNRPAVIWYKDNVICSSVAELDPQEITATLKNCK